MLNPTLIAKLQENIKGEIITNALMCNFTTWKVGGMADVLIKPANREDLANILKIANEFNTPITVIGKGSNLLVSDNGIEGIVINIGDTLNNFTLDENGKLIAEAGVTMRNLAFETVRKNFLGLEWACGIPGNLGGAIIMNAGAYGNHIGNFVTTIELMEYNGTTRRLKASDLTFSYRDSGIPKNAIILSAELSLNAGDGEAGLEQMRELLKTRAKNQPLEYPSCGSVFKNPISDHAGRLVEVCGLKGLQVGGAMVSLKHGNFIINIGNATAKDILALIEEVRKIVLAKEGINLETEVKLLGREM